MSSFPVTALLWAAALSSGLIAGIYFSFQAFRTIWSRRSELAVEGKKRVEEHLDALQKRTGGLVMTPDIPGFPVQ